MEGDVPRWLAQIGSMEENFKKMRGCMARNVEGKLRSVRMALERIGEFDLDVLGDLEEGETERERGGL